MRMDANVMLIVVTVWASAGCAPSSPPHTSTPAATSPAESGSPVIAGTAPPGAIVSLEMVAGQTWPLPAGPAVMDQFGKEFVPAELFARVGQPVEFRNTEDIEHNVHVQRSATGAAIFHVSTDPREKYVHTFDRAGRYDVSCDLHPGMAATIVVTTSPYYAVAAADGSFTMRGFEPGSYRIVASFEGRELAQDLVVTGARTSVTIGTR